MPDPLAGLMNASEAAKLLRVCQTTVHNLCNEKRLAYYNIGKGRFFKADDIQAYIDSCRVEAEEKPRPVKTPLKQEIKLRHIKV